MGRIGSCTKRPMPSNLGPRFLRGPYFLLDRVPFGSVVFFVKDEVGHKAHNEALPALNFTLLTSNYNLFCTRFVLPTSNFVFAHVVYM